MKRDEKGFTLIELLVACAIIALLGSVTTMAIFQTIESTERNESHMAVVRQVQNAGYWICHDARMAESIAVDNLEYPNFIILTWTEQDYDGGDSTYHSVTYFFENISGGVGELKRNHWSSAGVNEDTLIAKYIYYDTNDPGNTSKASYLNPVLTVTLRALFGDAGETREYEISRRPTFAY